MKYDPWQHRNTVLVRLGKFIYIDDDVNIFMMAVHVTYLHIAYTNFNHRMKFKKQKKKKIGERRPKTLLHRNCLNTKIK